MNFWDVIATRDSYTMKELIYFSLGVISDQDPNDLPTDQKLMFDTLAKKLQSDVVSGLLTHEQLYANRPVRGHKMDEYGNTHAITNIVAMGVTLEDLPKRTPLRLDLSTIPKKAAKQWLAALNLKCQFSVALGVAPPENNNTPSPTRNNISGVTEESLLYTIAVLKQMMLEPAPGSTPESSVTRSGYKNQSAIIEGIEARIDKRGVKTRTLSGIFSAANKVWEDYRK